MTYQEVCIIIRINGWQYANVKLNKDIKCEKRGIVFNKDTQGNIYLDHSWQVREGVFGCILHVIENNQYVEKKAEIKREDFNVTNFS